MTEQSRLHSEILSWLFSLGVVSISIFLIFLIPMLESLSTSGIENYKIRFVYTAYFESIDIMISSIFSYFILLLFWHVPRILTANVERVYDWSDSIFTNISILSYMILSAMLVSFLQQKCLARAFWNVPLLDGSQTVIFEMLQPCSIDETVSAAIFLIWVFLMVIAVFRGLKLVEIALENRATQL